MPHPLDGARLKVVRAEKHLESLKLEVGRYLDTRPYEFATEHESDTDVLTVKPAIVKVDPPLELGCIFGDCLTNLRISLDYIAWQVASKCSATALVVGRDRIYFPLAKDAAAFGANGRAQLARYSVPATVIDLIESIQPYQTGYESLGLLTSLVNRDKHCLPLLTIATANTTSIDVAVAGKPIAQCVMHPPGSKAIVFGHNVFSMSVRRLTPEDLPALLAAVPPTTIDAMHDIGIDIARPLSGNEIGFNVTETQDAARPRPTEEQARSVKVNGQVTVFVSLQNPPMPLEPVDRTLEQIVKCVANIVPRFDPFV
jgi:hypothetical protein